MQATVTHRLPSPTDSVLDAAALYIEQGFRTVILHGVRDDGTCTCGRTGGSCKPGKHPAITAWQKKVYATADDFRDAFASARTPAPANLGIVLGEQLNGDYLLVVDGDDVARMAVLEAVLGALPVTLTARTGGGGNHRIYALAAGMDPKRLRNRVGLRIPSEPPSPGVDVRVAGGQVVVCPSLHVSGDRYSWAVEAPIAELPAAWFDVMAEPVATPRTARPTTAQTGVTNLNDRYIARVIERAAQDIASRGKGERNGVLFSKSCTVLEYCAGAGLAFTHALGELRSAGVACGLPRAEVDDVLRKAERQVRSSGKTRVPPPSERGRAPATAATAEPAAEPVADAEPAAEAEWMTELARSQQGGIKATFGNVCLILRHDEAFRGHLTYNRMRIAPFIDGRALEDADVARVREDIERRWGFSPANDAVIQAILLISSERSFHPLQDYLGGLTWDGVERLSRVAGDVLGSAPDALTQRMLRCWFISAVARALDPGCKVDTTLVLVGEQGYRKSTFFATLGGEWFSDTYVDIRNKDGILQIHAAWLHEWAEIERVTIKTSSSDVKAFLTSARDSVRPPFGRGVLIQPRSSVIVGSTNKAFLDDETGSRRFWPVPVCQVVNVAQLAEWRDQLWAEAVAAYRAREPWWLTTAEDAERELAAEDHMVDNPWLEKVEGYLRHPDRHTGGVSVADVLTGALGIDIGKAAHGDATRVGKVLKRMHWWSHHETRGAARVRVHYPPKGSGP